MDGARSLDRRGRSSTERRITLHRRALWLEYFTVGWNVVEAVVAIGAGIIAGSVALIGFGADSAIEVISAVGLLWRLRKAGPHAEVSEESRAEKRALYVVALTFFLLAIYITWEAVNSLIGREEPPHVTSGDHLGGAVASGYAGFGLRQAASGQGDGQPRPGRRLEGNLGVLLPVAVLVARGWRVRGSRLVVG